VEPVGKIKSQSIGILGLNNQIVSKFIMTHIKVFKTPEYIEHQPRIIVGIKFEGEVITMCQGKLR
jgi:hypothetical protein